MSKTEQELLADFRYQSAKDALNEVIAERDQLKRELEYSRSKHFYLPQLSKMEYYAAMAMQGCLASRTSSVTAAEVARDSVKCARGLVKELEHEEGR